MKDKFRVLTYTNVGEVALSVGLGRFLCRIDISAGSWGSVDLSLLFMHACMLCVCVCGE